MSSYGFSRFFCLEFSFDYIIKHLRDVTHQENRSYFYVTSQDLNNVLRKFNMCPRQHYKEDLMSLRLCADEGNLDDGIRFFQMPSHQTGRDFALVVITPVQLEWLQLYKGISIDDTHHTTRYSLKLATIMVVDDANRGLNAAFLTAGSMTSVDVKILFDQVKKLVPKFAPKFILSDEALAFYNGFKASFPESSAVLLFCRFYILQSWKYKAKLFVKVFFSLLIS
ncbi:hypothetical protein OESDEN_11215 [Oesophagostomum dentatum]|uniref:MULE transposase domain-containing protein n=1 Tax=Oesophagostomum dentatum TaxID=61180 RepID=A0A0B1SUH7_OESDE|nr:hypothetical protein OESDEN_11215 [Oesophagostomum dentatum]